MLTQAEYASFDALGLMELQRRGEVSKGELAECAREAIGRLNPELNFLVAADDGLTDGLEAPFSGLPFLIKEGVGARGQPLVLGSRLTAGLTAEDDCELVTRLRRSGVAILGSTSAPEFGNSPTTESVLHGATRNPWNTEHMPGGSSGGASVAVAAGVVPVAQSSDGGGSIRTPAHCCGIFGLKPSRGRTPVGPKSFGGIFGFGVSHVSTRSVRDSAAFLDCLEGGEFGALYRVPPPQSSFLAALQDAPRQMRIAFSTSSPSGVATSAECAGATLATAKACAELGHHVEEAAPAYDWELFRSAMVDIWSAPFPFAISSIEQIIDRKAGPENIEGANLAMLKHGDELSVEQLIRSMTSLHNIAAAVEGFFANWDIFLSPVALTSAPRLGVIDSANFSGSALEWFDTTLGKFAAFAPIFNVTGQPAASIPIGMSPDGLPIGVQAAGRLGDEQAIFTLASQLEQVMPWRDRQPRLHAGRQNMRGVAR